MAENKDVGMIDSIFNQVDDKSSCVKAIIENTQVDQGMAEILWDVLSKQSKRHAEEMRLSCDSNRRSLEEVSNRKTMRSELPASGFTRTATELHCAAEKLVELVKEGVGKEGLVAHVWAYREQGFEHLSCDIFLDEDRAKNQPITVCIGGENDFDCIDEPEVTDMTEALHFVGIVTAALGARVEIGLQTNEVNPDVLRLPLEEGRTNGLLQLWK